MDLRDWKEFSGDRMTPAIITHVSIHSEDVRAGSLFVALEGGAHTDGHDFVEGVPEGDERIGDSRLTVNLDRVRENVERFQLLGKRVAAMVKANAYGTDSVHLAHFLEKCGIDCFGVAHVHEAISLRLAGIESDLLVIHAAPYDADQIVKWRLQPAVGSLDLIQAIQGPAKVHLNIDTGMSRLGCRPEEAAKLAHAIKASPHLELEGVMTHFTAPERVEEQLALFADIEAPWRHAAATTTAHLEIPNCNMIRIGMGLLENAVTLTSRIIKIHTLKKGERVSYGGTYTIQRERERIGVVPVGYFDGIHRSFSNRGHLLVHGEKAPIVGTICMDFLMIDLTEIPQATVHDTVLFFGEDEFGNRSSLDEFAAMGERYKRELLACLGPRIQRLFLYEGAAREIAAT